MNQSEQPKDRYLGMRSNGNRRIKYRGCASRTVNGSRVRLLTDVEIDELQAHIERELVRRSIV